MKSRWDFSIYKVVFLFIAGLIIGGAIAMLITSNVSLLSGLLQIVAMIISSLVILMSCRKKEEVQ